MITTLISPNKKAIIASLLCVSCLLATPAFSQQLATKVVEPEQKVDVNEVKFMTKQNFMLAGKYYAGNAAQAGVLLLHDCSHDSNAYSQLAEKLSEHGLHALALDLRGYGDSVSDDFSHTNIKKGAKNISSYESEVTLLTSYWKDDVMAAYQYLRKRIDKMKNIAVVSAGCSAAQAIYLAQDIRINSFVMLTPILNYMEKEHFKNLIDIPIYFIASTQHTSTFETTKELFEWNGDNHTLARAYKGDLLGQSLLRSKKFLANDIALWLSNTLQ
ncbi:alpha/beta hydrolase [Thalassotalea sp. G2M2-11]|uniref:serine aminopeptidase domain-containing protein n=1 Tax=Thalassotalea sp. G2M2-11 TaxID=2787627 RepID=UPI0019D1DBB4|nr:alpha/beta hydrolase [Thalassotalea sp. G2M2-11]